MWDRGGKGADPGSVNEQVTPVGRGGLNPLGRMLGHLFTNSCSSLVGDCSLGCGVASATPHSATPLTVFSLFGGGVLLLHPSLNVNAL